MAKKGAHKSLSTLERIASEPEKQAPSKTEAGGEKPQENPLVAHRPEQALYKGLEGGSTPPERTNIFAEMPEIIGGLPQNDWADACKQYATENLASHTKPSTLSTNLTNNPMANYLTPSLRKPDKYRGTKTICPCGNRADSTFSGSPCCARCEKIERERENVLARRAARTHTVWCDEVRMLQDYRKTNWL